MGRREENGKEPPGELTHLIGDVGRWHCLILAVIFVNSIFNAYGQLAMAFMLPPNVDYNCSEQMVTDWSAWSHLLPPHEEATKCYNFVNGTKLECSHWTYDHSIHKSTILEQWNLVCHNDHLKPYPQALSMAGLIIGNVVFSHFSDHYGRRPAVYLGMILCAVSGIAATTTNSFMVFNIGRFLSSVSKIGIQASTVIYIEAIKPSYRWMFSLLNGFGFHLGMVAVASTAYYGDSWRYLQGLISGPAVAVLPFLFFVWESPRWLYSQKRFDEASRVVENICRLNGIPRTKVDFHLPAIRGKYETLNSTQSCSVLSLLRRPPGRSTNMALNTAILWFLCFTCGILFYSATFMSTAMGASPHISFCVPIVGELISISLVAAGVKFMRRRRIVIITQTFGGLGFMMLAFSSNIATASQEYYVQMAAVTLIRASSAAFTQIYPIYSAEIYPTPLRNVGIGFCDLMYRLASTVDPFGRYYLPKIHPKLLPFLYAGLSFSSAVLTLALPETMNKALDDGIFARLSRRVSEIATQLRRASTTAFRRPSSAPNGDRKRVKETTALEDISEDSTRF